MGFKDKMNDLKNKTTDALVNGKATYEKKCINLECFSLKDIRESEDVKAIVNFDKKWVEFSGVLDQLCKDLKKPWFFMTKEGKIFDLVEDSIKQETIEIELKAKTDTHVITKATIVEKELELKIK